jgi:putative alpha-1,2-mannosidase
MAEKVKAGLVFDLGNSSELLVKVGISFVSNKNAKLNLETEIDHWNFDQVAVDADIIWNNELNAIEVEGGSDEQKRVFYTALYHALIVPNIFEDVNGEYIGMDKQIHQSDGYTHYTLFSLWDTYRATHPLYTIIQQERTKDFINQCITCHYSRVFFPYGNYSQTKRER